MTTTIQKWGNSLAVRIPKDMIRRLALQQGSGVVMREDRDAIVIRKQERATHLVGKNDWIKYRIPSAHKKENVSGIVDSILYGVSR